MEKIAVVESLRGFAAIYVFAYHFVFLNFDRSQWWTWPFLFGHEAVMLFFLISGFAIMYSTEVARDKSFRSYFSRRFFRIYPIFLLALAVSYVLADPDSDTISGHVLLGNIFMLQDLSFGKPGVLFDTFGDNYAMWSLSYECWFYLLFFPIFLFFAERAQLALVTAVGLIAILSYNLVHFGPLLYLAYFPMWWAGAEIGRAFLRKKAMPFAAIYVSVGLISLAFGVEVLVVFLRGGQLSFGLHPVLEFRHALACLAMIAALQIIRRVGLEVAWVIAPFGIAAPISYGIYAVHTPVISAAIRSDLPFVIATPLVIIAVLVLAWWAEGPYQRTIVATWRSGPP